jgi:ubiquinone/menaquinone biosynthesis C-methylase UbiE
MTITVEAVSEVLGKRLPIYRLRKPVYQAIMLEALRRVWRPEHRRVLDVGGGTGVIAQAVSELFPVDRVVSIDVEDRFLDTLTIEHRTYDGRRLPFADGEFDCVMFNNVIHHVAPADRLPLLLECRRVAPDGGLLIKDHLQGGRLDRLRLAALDLIGNAPFHGMVRASYLSIDDWRDLARAAGYEIAGQESGPYRGGLFGLLFPNRLETTMSLQASNAGHRRVG